MMRFKFDLQRFADLTISSGGTYNVDESNSTITVATTEAVTLKGNADTELSEVVINSTVDNVDVTISDLNIINASTAIITVGDGAENKLNITGKNTLEVKSGPGACVNIGGGLTVNGTGSLKGTSINSAVIGINGNQSKPDSNITIESGTFDLTCRSGACAIGGAGARGNAVGNITITGTADITASAPAGHASPIGASYWGSCGDILINGDAKITSTSGQHSAAIGGASLTSVGNITINGNATVNAINASKVDDSAAIGSGLGSMTQSLGDIIIGGNAKVTATSGLGLAIDNIEWHRENQQYGTTAEGDYPIVNDNTITIGDNATFTGHSGDIYTATTINGTEFKAAEISYNSTDGLLYSGGSELDKEALEETLLEINEGGSYTIAEGSVGKILINTTEAVTLQGGNYDLEEIQIIGQSDNINLTINDLRITNTAISESVIRFGSGADNKLTINGTNDFSIVKGNKAGINIGGGGNIGGTGSLKIVTLNGAAIGTNGEQDLSSSNITIDSGTFDLMSRSGACGIGCAGNGSKIGNITITGTAHVVSKTPQGYAAAIGSAYRGTVGDILINGDATVEATSGLQTAAIGSAVYCKNGNITIGGRASVVANTTSTDVKDAAIGGTYGEQVNSIGDINIIEDATVIANSAHGLALDNRLFVETGNYATDYWTVNADSVISISGDTSTANQSTVILTNGNTSDIVTIGGRAYQGSEIVFNDGNLAMTGNWISLESGGWSYNSVVQMDYLTKNRDDQAAQFTLSGGNLKDADGDGRPDNVSIGSILYVQQSGVHTNIRNLSGNVIYNGDALGIEGDDSYNIEAVSPIDLSEEFPLPGYYITDANVTAIRAVSNGATISPRGTAGTETAADWISFDNEGGTVTFRDGTYCLYTEKQFFSRAYTKLSISNNNAGVEVSTSDDLIQTIGNLADGYAITIESGINVGEKINFETSGNGVIVVKTTANSGKYSLDADSDEWQYQNYTINGGGNFALVFGDNGSVVGMEDFDGTLETDDTTLSKGEWVTLEGGGFEYTGNATNNPSKSATFTVSGDSITSTDNLTVTNNVYFTVLGGNRMAVAGLSGNASVDGVELGISGDNYYSAHFAEAGDGASNIALMNVSDGSTIDNNYSVGVEDSTAQIQFSDGEHVVFTNAYFPTQDFTTITAENGGNGFTLNIVDDKFETISGLSNGYDLNITAGGNLGDSLAIQSDGKNGTINVAGETFTVNGDKEFGLKFNEDSVELVDYEGWTTLSSGVYNYVSDSLDFTLEGSDIDWDVFRIGNKVVPLGDDAYQIALASIGGSIKVNGVDMGIYNDDKYTVHVYVYPNTAATADIATNISDGASVEGSYDTLIIDDNSKVHISDGKRVVVMGMHYVDKDFTSIDVENGGKGFYLQSLNDKFTTFAGLSSGFNISIEPGGNIGDEVTFETDGGKGTINVGDMTLEVDGDEEFAILINDDGNFTGVKNFDGNSTITGGGSNATMTGGDGDDLLASGNAVNVTMTGGAGNDTFRGGASLKTALITDYTEGEDVIYHAQPFAAFPIDGSTDGSDYVFQANGRKITVQDSANKVIKVVDSNGDTRLYNKNSDIIEDILEKYSEDEIATLTGGGTSSIDLAKEDYDVAIVSADSTGKKDISLGGGLAIIEETGAKVSITTSKGVDTIYSMGDNVTVNLNEGGNAWLFVPEGKMTLEGYDDTTGAGFNANYNNILPEIVDKIASKEISFDDGKLTMGAAIVSFGEAADKIVNFYDAKDNLQKVGFASDGAKIDANSRKENLLLVGGIDSTLLGGNGNDTIFAMTGSHVDTGAGKNYIEIEERDASDDGVTIALNEGKNTIANFKAGFGDDSDRLFVGVKDTVDFEFDGANLTVKLNDNSRSGLLNDVASDAPFVNLLMADANGPVKVAVAQEGEVITVDDEIADLYIGKKSGVDFTNYQETLTLNLGSEETSVGAGEILFGGINQVTLGSGRGNLIGSASRETLTAGTGATSIRGGAGRDLLIGNTSADKDGTTEFIFKAGDGKDTVSNFEFLTDENVLTADKISVDSAVTNVVLKNSGDVIVQLGDDWITLEDAQGKSFQINEFVAQVDTNITYDDAANYFLATSKNASVTVGEEAEIWLDSSHGKSFVGNIKTLDASNSDGKNTLAGNDLDNVICAGSGDASLWGGNGGDDLLIGGKSHNLFFYTSGNGNDTISGANDGDAVIFSNVSIDQITGTNITAGGVTIDFKDGGKLNVASTNAVEFAFNDATYFADHSAGTWQQK